MNKRVLLAVDGSKKSLEATAILGQLLKDQSDLGVLLFHCVHQLEMLYPAELADVEISQKVSLDDQKKVGDAILDSSRKALVESGFPEDRIFLELGLGSTDPAHDILAEAEAERIRTVVLGRRGRSPLGNFLLGSVSNKVAQYARYRTVWIVDTPVNQTRKVLVALADAPDSRALTYYTAEYLARIPGMHYTFFHIMPPIPPTFWDDGHILGPDEQKDRQAHIEKWRLQWTQKVEKFMDEACHSVVEQGVPAQKVEKRIVQTKEGIGRDLLNEIEHGEYEVVVMGKKSFYERKPFLMGSHANKVLQHIQRAILCLVDATH